MHANHNDTFSAPQWPGADNQAAELAILEERHTDFMTHWRQALSALIPVELAVRAVRLDYVRYADFIQGRGAHQDIQVYEIDALQCLCAWSVARHAFAQAVDCMFGGGRLPIRELTRRYTPIEQAVRNRCMDSLASAYEAAWHSTYPLRLQTLRQETHYEALRLAPAEEQVLHAHFELSIQGEVFSVDLCLPRRAVRQLIEPSHEAEAPVQEAVRQVWGSALQHNVYAAPVEAVAVLAHKEMTVAQLLSLSIGQVIPMDLSEPVTVQVDGVTVMQGRYGVRGGHYAVKVESIQDTGAWVPAAVTDPASVAPDTQPEVPEAVPEAAPVVPEAAAAPRAPGAADTRHLDDAVQAISEFSHLVQQSESTP